MGNRADGLGTGGTVPAEGATARAAYRGVRGVRSLGPALARTAAGVDKQFDRLRDARPLASCRREAAERVCGLLDRPPAHGGAVSGGRGDLPGRRIGWFPVRGKPASPHHGAAGAGTDADGAPGRCCAGGRRTGTLAEERDSGCHRGTGGEPASGADEKPGAVDTAVAVFGVGSEYGLEGNAAAERGHRPCCPQSPTATRQLRGCEIISMGPVLHRVSYLIIFATYDCFDHFIDYYQWEPTRRQLECISK